MECPTVCLIWMNVPNKLVYNEQGFAVLEFYNVQPGTEAQ